uniref:Bm7995 n=1 Tax=Brugia malayi TaxID=6279 RepID=A0A1I9G8B6_BRUMA|nr:Bm7995 [Brugia malayi]
MGPDQLGAAHFHTASKPLKEIDIRLPENLVKVISLLNKISYPSEN